MRRLTCCFLLLALPASLLAHNTWLVPMRFRAAPGDSIRVRVATSEAFPSSDSLLKLERVARFTLRDTSGARNVTGYREDGLFLVADVVPPRAGHVVVVAESKPRAFVLPAKTFAEYLKEEHRDDVLAARQRAGTAAAEGRERYRKVTKAILCVGGKPGEVPADALFQSDEGSWLEIIPEQSPCGLKRGDSIRVRVLFNGKPYANAHVAAGYAGTKGHHYPFTTKTDADGRARFKLTRDGVWYIRAHNIVATQNDSEADWESAFSTLTFEVLP